MDGQHGERVNQVEQPRPIRLIARPCMAMDHGKIDRYVPAGATVAEHLRGIGWKPDTLNARVFIDGEFIEQARWEYAVPRAGQFLSARVIPMDGGGKDIFRIVAMVGIIALALAAPYLAPVGWGLVGAWTGAALSAAISIAGSLALTARVPPARPRLCDYRQVQHG